MCTCLAAQIGSIPFSGNARYRPSELHTEMVSISIIYSSVIFDESVVRDKNHFTDYNLFVFSPSRDLSRKTTPASNQNLHNTGIFLLQSNSSDNVQLSFHLFHLYVLLRRTDNRWKYSPNTKTRCDSKIKKE